MGYVGFRTGLHSEFVKLIALVVGFFVSFWNYQTWADFLSRSGFFSIGWASAITMALVVVAVYWGVTRLLGLLEKLIQVTFQERLNQFGGLVAGLVRGLLVASVLLIIFQQLPSPYLQASVDQRSLCGRAIARMAPAVYDTLAVLPKILLRRL